MMHPRCDFGQHLPDFSKNRREVFRKGLINFSEEREETKKFFLHSYLHFFQVTAFMMTR